MENLRAIGDKYRSFQDEMKLCRSNIKKHRKDRDFEKVKVEKARLREIKTKKKEFYQSLNKEEAAVYQEYRKIDFQIKKSQYLKKYDKIRKKVFKKVNPAYIYILPAALGALMFTILPCIFMLIGSFFKIDLVDMQSTRFVGFWNYEMTFTRDTEFVKSIWNTMFFAFLTVGLLMVVTLFMASWLSKNTKIHNLSQTMIFTPHIASMVSVAILWTLMLDPEGIVNQFIHLFGIKGPNWLRNTRTSLLSVAFVTVWKSIGYYVLLIISGLNSIPAYVYEAAKLDKASKFTIFRKITVPLLSPTLMFVFIIKFINAFKSFSAIDLMTQGGPQGSSMVLGYWIYNVGRVKFNYGFSMAGAVVLTLMVSVFTFIAYRHFNKKVVYN
jgi:sn-glycerol 3-phosphate transport system permease protein